MHTPSFLSIYVVTKESFLNKSWLSATASWRRRSQATRRTAYRQKSYGFASTLLRNLKIRVVTGAGGVGQQPRPEGRRLQKHSGLLAGVHAQEVRPALQDPQGGKEAGHRL